MGSGGVAVRTNDNVALPPPPQSSRQGMPGTWPQEESESDARLKSASAEYLLFMDYPNLIGSVQPVAWVTQSDSFHAKDCNPYGMQTDSWKQPQIVQLRTEVAGNCG